MQPISSSARKRLSLLVILVAALFYARYAWLQYSSYRNTSRQSIEGIRAACTIDPSNADNFQLLGAYQLAAFEPESARDTLQRAAALNPWDSRTWLMLATVYGISGESDRQQSALEAASSADPRTPEVAWEVGNFYLVRGDTGRTLRFFRTVVESGSDQSNDAFRLSWDSTHDVDLILSQMMPASVQPHLALLSFLTGRNEDGAAAKVWQKVVQFGKPIALIDGGKYVDFLVAHHEIAAAKRAWTATTDVDRIDQLHRGDNFVVNGDFEEPISGVGFDWHYTRNPCCFATIDDSEGKTGTHSLAIQINGAFDDVGIYQFVPVTPGERYDLDAFMKSENIESSSGPRLGVFDAYTGQQLGLTDDLLESNVWREESLQFNAGPNTELVTIKIVRTPANPQIKGKLWIDDIRLTKR